jgi:hypothetical protein
MTLGYAPWPASETQQASLTHLRALASHLPGADTVAMAEAGYAMLVGDLAPRSPELIRRAGSFAAGKGQGHQLSSSCGVGS